MKFTVYQESRRGQRPENQDRVAYSYTREALLMVIADGMGGHLHGEIAAQIAVQYIIEAFQRNAQPLIPDELMFLSRSLSNAHNAILDYSFDKRLPETPRTTVVVCLVQNNVAHWAHAGDSRLYMIRNGQELQRTKDHSRLQLMVDQGIVTEEDAFIHPARNRIFSCLGGTQSPQIEFSSATPIEADDLIVMCTDGVWGNLGLGELAHLFSDTDIIKASPFVLDQAEKRGGSSCDNLSMLAMRWHNDIDEDMQASISTLGMNESDFTTQMDGFTNTASTETSNLTESDIERAIREINSAIKKYPRDTSL